MNINFILTAILFICDLSLSGNGASIAMTTHVNIIAAKIKYSNIVKIMLKRNFK